MRLGDEAFFSKTIVESEVYQFAGLTGDYNPIHINKVEAEKSIFGERIVHGMLVASLLSNVIAMKLPGNGTIYLEQDCKFLKPIKIGDTVTVTVKVAEYINYEKGIVRLENRIVNQNDEVVIDGYSVVKVKKEIIED